MDSAFLVRTHVAWKSAAFINLLLGGGAQVIEGFRKLPRIPIGLCSKRVIVTDSGLKKRELITTGVAPAGNGKTVTSNFYPPARTGSHD